MPASKKTYISVLLISFLSLSLFSQGWKYSQHFGVTVKSEVRGITLDSDSNMYVSLFHREDVTHTGPFGSAVYPTSGRQDIQLIKFAADGDTLWHRSIGGTQSDYPRNIVLDNNEDPYMAGIYRRADLTIQGITLPFFDEYDIFLAKYTQNGGGVFARRVAYGPGDDVVEQIAIDGLGNIYMLGHYQESVFFDGDTLEAEQSTYNMFLAKFNPNGGFRWARNIITDDESGNTKLINVTVANNTEIYLGGFFLGDLTIGTSTISSRGATEEDMVLIKVDSTGSPVWIRMGGSENGADRLNGIASDVYGNIYITGYFTEEAVLDSTGQGLLNSSPIQSAGGYDMIMAKYNKNGTLIWKNRNGDVGDDIAYGVVVHENIVQFTGYISGEVTFNTVTLSTGATDNEDTGFFIYDTDGNPITARSIQGNDEDRGTEIEYDLNGNTYIGGYFSSDTLLVGDDELVKDAGSTSDGFVAKYKNPFTATFTEVEKIRCTGESNGVLVVTPYFGVEPYTYSWSHDAGLNDSVASGLEAGTYSVTITDSRLVTAENTIELIDPDPIAITAVSNDVSCFPADGPSNNGSIDISVTGGTVKVGYEFIWEALSGSGVNATSEDQATLTKGQYRVTVTDDNLCFEDSVFTIDQPDAIMFSGSAVTPATGGGSDGAIDLNPSGGNDGSPYAFLWSNLETTEDISNLSAGSYLVQVTDILGCENDTSFLVTDVDAFLAFISDKEDVDCRGNATGSATVGTSGGTGSYSYAWENSMGNPIGGDFPNITNVPAGTYYVTVTDNGDLRTAQASVIISEPAQILNAVILGTNLDCNGDNSGVADLTVTGGSLPYTFLWSNGATSEDLVNVAATTYSVTITDNNGCLENDEVELTEPSALDINITLITPILCNGELSGVLTASATGGFGPKDYVWNDPGTQTVATATNLGAGYYTVIATDQHGCQISDNYQLNQPPALILNETHLDVSCYGEEDGYIDLIPTGGTPPNNYSWSGGLPPVQDQTNISPGTYTVIVTDNNNCAAELEVEIVEPTQVVIISIDQGDILCPGGSSGTIEITAEGGTGALSYSVDGGDVFVSENIFADLSAGTYTVVVTDEQDCITTGSDISLSEPSAWELDTVIVHATGDSTGSISIIADGATPPYTYTLIFGSEETSNSTGEFMRLIPGDYSAFVSDNNLCESETLYITVNDNSAGGDEIIIYSAFSPNGDEKNDTWNIGNIDQFPDCSVIVVNAWGSKVFESVSGYPEPWDGTYNGRELPAGTYYYIIDLGNGTEAYTGPVSIVR